MTKSPARKGNPAPGVYRPHVAARRPGGRPSVKPAFRVLVHHKYLPIWNELADRLGLANAQQFWDHVAMTPGCRWSPGAVFGEGPRTKAPLPFLGPPGHGGRRGLTVLAALGNDSDFGPADEQAETRVRVVTR
jgi:hypothetical protein